MNTLSEMIKKYISSLVKCIYKGKDSKNDYEIKEFQSIDKDQLNKDEPVLNIVNDLWTIKDDLGLNIYVNTLIRFLTHKDSHFPLSISIQAPWGGGKTSLMRMIQNKLDLELSQDIEPHAKYKQLKNLVDDYLRLKHRRIEYYQFRVFKVQGSKFAPKRLTVWFNPWRYQQGKHMWGGLVDCVFREIINKMETVERELFLLTMNLKIESMDDLASWIKYHTIMPLWNRIRRTIINSIIGITISLVIIILELSRHLYTIDNKILMTISDSASTGPLHTLLYYLLLTVLFIPVIIQQTIFPSLSFGILGLFAILSIIFFVSFSVFKFLRARSYIQNSDVNALFEEYSKIPEEIDLDHLRRAFDAIPISYRPTIIFVDDLDRCSPDTVSRIIEGVNYLLLQHVRRI